jgi:hypothetical protein
MRAVCNNSVKTILSSRTLGKYDVSGCQGTGGNTSVPWHSPCGYRGAPNTLIIVTVLHGSWFEQGANSDATRIILEGCGGERRRGHNGTIDCSTGHTENQDGVAHGLQLAQGPAWSGHTLGFLLEAGVKVVERDEFRSNDLDGPMDRKLAVKRLVDIGQTAPAQPFRDLVRTNGGTDEVGHGRRT